MNYKLYVNSSLVGFNLSQGELNQWLLDLHLELKKEKAKIFRDSLGFIEEDFESFEDFLYETEIKVPKSIEFGEEIVEILEDDF